MSIENFRAKLEQGGLLTEREVDVLAERAI